MLKKNTELYASKKMSATLSGMPSPPSAGHCVRRSLRKSVAVTRLGHEDGWTDGAAGAWRGSPTTKDRPTIKDRRHSGTTSFGEKWYCLSRPRPVWRGRLHLVCALASPVWMWGQLRLCSGDGSAFAAALLSLLGTAACLSFSAMYHTVHWALPRELLLSDLDLIGIFCQIAFCMTPWYVLLMPGSTGWCVVAALALSVAAGTWLTLSKVEMGRHAATCVYIAQAAAQIGPMAHCRIFERVTPAELSLFWVGMALYLVGSQVYARKAPDPWPDTFGYHEIWHVMVVLAAACTYHTNSSILARALGAA